MRGLTLTAPWGTLIAVGAKKIETRSWATSYRGLVAIHQAKGLGPVGGRRGLFDLCWSAPFLASLGSAMTEICYQNGEPYPNINPDVLPLGRIVAVATLADVGRACVGYEGITPVPAVRWPDGKIENVPQPELSFGDYSPGRRIWRLVDIVALPEPVEAVGRQGLWMLGGRAAAAVAEQLGAAS